MYRTAHIFLVLPFIGTMACHLHGQGTVQFANSIESAVTNGTTGQLIEIGSSYIARLYYAPDGVTNESSFVELPVPGSFPCGAWFRFPGVFDGGTVTTPTNTLPGAFALFQVRLWPFVCHTPFETAYFNPAHEYGQSGVVRVKTGNPPGTGPGSLVASGLKGFTINRGALSVNDPVVTESDTTTNALFTIRLARPMPTNATVRFATSNGTAVASGDFIGTNGTLAFAPGETEKVVVVPVLSDSPCESIETFTLWLFDPTNAVIADGLGECMIVPLVPTFLVIRTVVPEGDAGTADAVFNVVLWGGGDQTVSVSFATSNGTAIASRDYVGTNGTLIFAPGETNKSVSITVLGDQYAEQDETFSLHLIPESSSVCLLAPAQGLILNDDSLPSLTCAAVNVPEGNAGLTPALFTVQLSAPSEQTVTVNFNTADDTAVAGRDYVSTNGMLTFALDEQEKSVSVGIVADTLHGTDRRFWLRLSDAVNASVAEPMCRGTIVDDDVLPPELHHFTWSFVPSPQFEDWPFAVTVTARDAAENRVSSFNGSLRLRALEGPPDQVIAGGHTEWILPMGTQVHDQRLQVIYLASELVGLQSIRSLALDVARVPSAPLNNWTIRMQHTTLSAYTAAPFWKTSGWTIVYQANEFVPSTGWVAFPFPAPFRFDGSNNLMVDFSFDNSSSGDSHGVCRFTPTASFRSVYAQANSTLGDPLLWGTTSVPVPFPVARVPNVILEGGEVVEVTPPLSGDFTEGVWTGRLAVGKAGVETRLVADDQGGHQGKGNAFSVEPSADADADGMFDAWELRYFGSINSPEGEPTADADHDLLINLHELFAGTDPCDAQSVLRITSVELTGDNLIIRFATVAAKLYRLERSAQVHPESGWMIVADRVFGDGGIAQLADVILPGTSQFYRVRLVP
jgi:hypothetical protein